MGCEATPSWLPPQRTAGGEFNLFGRDFETHFWVPERLTDKSTELVETANDFHYAMVNDHPRNDFYRQSLAAVVNSDTHVLEIGTGSGLLAMIAAKQGAKFVTAVEANRHMAALATRIIMTNGLTDRVKSSTNCRLMLCRQIWHRMDLQTCCCPRYWAR